MITLSHINKSFDDKSGKITILDDVSFTLPNNGFVSLCGKSGCGKTTLLKMIAGKIKNFDGTILYDNVNVLKEKNKDKFFAKNVFYLKYNDNFFLSLKVKQAIKFYLNKKEIDRANNYIKKFSLEALENKKISNLSSGELQKISLCFALAKKAKITILDEPICNIDSASIDMFLKEIKILSKESLVIYVSHFERDIANYYDIKMRLHDGKIFFEFSNEKSTYITNNTEDATKRFSFLSSFYLETIKPKGVYLFFRCILIILIMFQITLTLTNKISISYIYFTTLKEMSLNVIDEDKSTYDSYNCVIPKKLYSEKNPVGNYLHLPLVLQNEDGRTLNVKYFAKASDFYFSGLKEPLKENEIIISDIFADTLKLSTGSIAYGPSNDIYKNAYGRLEYKIKHIYSTNFYGNYESLNDVSVNEYKYETIFMSDKLFDYFEESCLNGVNGIYLNGESRLVTWKKEYDETINRDTLSDNEFYADYSFLESYGFDLNSMFNSIGNKVELSFNYKNKTIKKELIYKGYINYTNTIALSDNLYKELIEYFDIKKNEIFDYVLKNTIDIKALDFKKYCNKELISHSSITFTNSSIINDKQTIIETQVSMLKDNSIYLYFFGILFVLIGTFSILKNEYKSYVMLREKNFTIKNAIITNILIKIIFWIIIAIIMYWFSLNVVSIFISLL